VEPVVKVEGSAARPVQQVSYGRSPALPVDGCSA